MTDPDRLRFIEAVNDFRRARRQAELRTIVGQLTGKTDDLLCYQDVTTKLKVGDTTRRGLQEIPLDAIVGSVGRCAEFTREFLPLVDSDERRWASIRVVADLGKLPPIKVYKIGEAYFVLDGNHRVSIARQLGASHICAHVVEVSTRVPLSPDDRPDDLILKAEYADFLERTRLDLLRPGADLTVSVPGQYPDIEEHIRVHRYYLGVEHKKDIPYEEAVVSWYDTVYLPVVEAVREVGILRDFPGRTETDLYLWVSEYRAELEAELGWSVLTEEVATDLVARSSPKPRRVFARIGDKIRERVTPRELWASPPPGHWRLEHLAVRRSDRLFCNVLVAVDGRETGWRAMGQALDVARHEDAHLFGLHVVPSEERRQDETARAIAGEFQRRCDEMGVKGRLSVEVGTVLDLVRERGSWTDLIVLSLSHPPAPKPAARLGSGLSALLRSSTRPVLTVPGNSSQFERVLLAYNASREADEALYVATYLSGRWKSSLTVVTVANTTRAAERVQDRAESYLRERGVSADFVNRAGPAAEAILEAAQAQEADLIVLGSYRRTPVLEVMLGSTVDHVLRTSRQPVLICR